MHKTEVLDRQLQKTHYLLQEMLNYKPIYDKDKEINLPYNLFRIAGRILKVLFVGP